MYTPVSVMGLSHHECPLRYFIVLVSVALFPCARRSLYFVLCLNTVLCFRLSSTMRLYTLVSVFSILFVPVSACTPLSQHATCCEMELPGKSVG